VGAGIATVTFAAIPATYNHLLVKAVCRSLSATETDTLFVAVNTDAAAHYEWEYVQGVGPTAGASVNAGSGFGLVGTVPGASASAGRAGIFDVDFLAYAHTVFHKTIKAVGGYTDAATATTDTAAIVQLTTWRQTAAISQLDFSFAGGSGANFVTGSAFYLYGIT
jgi:hypothetical protein